MADTRINALTTSTVSVTDDFLPIDGATAGTKKLSAFSPSFGGAVTVGQTLTTAGNATIGTGGNTTLTMGPSGAAYTHYIRSATAGGAIQIQGDPATGNRWLSLGHNNNVGAYSEGLRVDSNTLVTMPGTTGLTISTGITVASGAVGVGAPGTGGSFYVNTPSLNSSYSSGLGIDGSYPGGVGAQSVINIKAFGVMSGGGYGSTLSFQTTLNGTFNEVMRLTSGSVVQVLGTAASSSTITGALVVGSGGSGGLGVAGAIYAGGYVSTGTHARIGAQSSVVALSANNSVDGGLPAAWTGNYGVGVQYLGSSSNAFFIGDGSGGATYFYTRTSSTNTSRLAIDNVTGNITVPATAAATSASFGALVVGGGVGVAKEIITGGIVRCGGSNGLSLGSDTGNIRIDSAGPAGVEFRGLSAADTITGFTMREMALIDGTAAPSTRAGYATIYVDTADGDLKVKFGDGTVKTIATDT